MNFRECYSRLLYIADRDRSQSEIDNDTFQDSADVYERIFLSCSQEVYIFARGIKEQIFNNTRVSEAAINFLSKENTKLKFTLRAKDKEDYEKTINSPFLNTLKDLFPAKGKIEVEFYEGGDDWLDSIGSTTIGDDRIYRYRYLQSEYRATSRAHICFNAPDKCLEFIEKIDLALLNTEQFSV